MKTIILGWSSPDALGAPKIIASVDATSMEQSKIMDAADRHEFPTGIKFIAQLGIMDQPLRQAQFISNEVAEFKQARHQQAVKLDAEQRENNRKEGDRVNRIATANKALTAAAAKRNKALADVAGQKTLLAAALPAKDKDDIAKKIVTLRSTAETAIKEFEVVLELANIIKNSKSAPEDVAAAVELIKSPAKALDVKNSVAAAADKAAADKAAADKAAADKAAADKAAADKAAADKAAADKAADANSSSPS
jgi:hypothetical protein